MELLTERNYQLFKLRKYLYYEISTSALYVASFFWGITIYPAILAAVLFTPYMIIFLFKERKFGWISFFIIIVIIPLVLGFVLNIGETGSFVLKMISLAMFYLYCLLLRMAIRGWIS